MVKLKLQANFPELKFILSTLNRMIIQGNKVTIAVNHNFQTKFVSVKLQRCKTYSFVELKRDLLSFDDKTKKEFAELENKHIFLFETDDVGSYLGVSGYDSYLELPKFEVLGIPEVIIPELDSVSAKCQVNVSFPLRKKFDELFDFVKIFNLLLARDFYARMTVREVRHLELHFTDGIHDSRPSLTIGFGLHIPYRNSKEAATWDDEIYGKEACAFNRLLIKNENTVRKFYCIPPTVDSHGPRLEFKAL